jgi:hypothetical protein
MRRPLQVLDTKTESTEVLGSLSTLSGFYGDNSAASRRKLRGTIEQQALANNLRFLQAAEEVIKVSNGAGWAPGVRCVRSDTLRLAGHMYQSAGWVNTAHKSFAASKHKAGAVVSSWEHCCCRRDWQGKVVQYLWLSANCLGELGPW